MLEDITKDEENWGFICQTEPAFLLEIYGKDNKPLVTIKPDATVIIHHSGADKEAAERFWSCLQIYGKSLLRRIEELEEENKKLKG